MKDNLYSLLKKYGDSKVYPFHMPGHKRQMKGRPMEAFYDIDITEVPGFDDLHAPEGVIKDISRRFKALYHGADTHLLVNGSTGGILSAISALLSPGDTLLMARNCHRSAYNAVSIRGLKTRYIYPEVKWDTFCGPIDPEDIRGNLDNGDDIKAVFITSPTYDGVVSDIRVIAGICHSHGIPLIVDAAHGPHFVLDERFPLDGVKAGADIVIHSIHKTLPALTQTALLHVQGDLVDRQRLSAFLSIYQSSSPSYILMAGMEECVDILEKERELLCRGFFDRDRILREMMGELRHLEVIPMDDPCKIVVRYKAKNVNLFSVLVEKYGIIPEMSSIDSVTFIHTIMDTWEGIFALADALRDIGKRAVDYYDRHLDESATDHCDRRMDKRSTEHHDFNSFIVENKPEIVYTIQNAMESDREAVDYSLCEGRISADLVSLYPPGIPFIAPGEIIDFKAASFLQTAEAAGFNIRSRCTTRGRILCIR